MADEVTIKSFLVKLGFKQDEQALAKFEKGIERATITVVGLGTAIEAMAIKVATAVTHFSANLEQLYFMSRRVGDSATNIKSFAAAITNLGGSSNGAMSSMENLAKFLRENPGGEGWLGVVTKDAQGNMLELSDIMSHLAEQFRNEPMFQASRRASYLGIDDRTFLAMRSGDYDKELAGQKRLNGKDSFDQVAANAHKFQENLRNFGNTVVRLLLPVQDAIQTHLQGSLEKVVAYLQKNGPELAKRIGDVAEKLMGFLDRLTAWFLAHGDKLTVDLITGLNGLLAIIDAVAPKVEWLAGVFKVADDATDGWLGRILEITAALKFLGAGPLISGAFKALGWISKTFGVVRGVGGVGLAGWTGWAIGSALNQWFGLDEKIGGWFSDDRATNWKNALERVGFDPKEASALTMVGAAESSLDPHKESADRSHVGMMQLSPERNKNFEKLKGYYLGSMRSHQIDDQTLMQDQADFLWWEAHGGDKGTTDAYQQTHGADDVSVEDMVRKYVTLGQRPGKDTDVEIQHALNFGTEQAGKAAEALKQAVAASQAMQTGPKAHNDSMIKSKPENAEKPTANNVSQETTIIVNGADDSRKVADLVMDGQRRVNASLTRNFVPNVF